MSASASDLGYIIHAFLCLWSGPEGLSSNTLSPERIYTHTKKTTKQQQNHSQCFCQYLILKPKTFQDSGEHFNHIKAGGERRINGQEKLFRTRSNGRSIPMNTKKHLFTVKERLSPGSGCSERWQSLQQNSRGVSAWSKANSSRWSYWS